MGHTLPITKARQDLLRLVDKVSQEYTRIDLTKQGKIKATLVSPHYLNSLEETVFTLQHTLPQVKQSEFDLVKGAFSTLQQLGQLTKKVTGIKK